MEQLIKISTDESGKQAVSARELFLFLGYDRSQWARWYSSNIINNPFGLENEDWQGFDMMSNGNPTKEFSLSIEFAKRLCMMARTEKGEQARQYFLECERRAKDPVANITKIDLAKMLIESEEQRIATEQKLLEANTKIQQDAPKVLLAEALTQSKDTYLIKELAAYLSQNGYEIGQNNLYKQLRFNGFLCIKGSYYNLPSQKSIELDLFRIKKTVIHTPDGEIKTSNTVYVTGKGMSYFLTYFLKQSQRA